MAKRDDLIVRRYFEESPITIRSLNSKKRNRIEIAEGSAFASFSVIVGEVVDRIGSYYLHAVMLGLGVYAREGAPSLSSISSRSPRSRREEGRWNRMIHSTRLHQKWRAGLEPVSFAGLSPRSRCRVNERAISTDAKNDSDPSRGCRMHISARA